MLNALLASPLLALALQPLGIDDGLSMFTFDPSSNSTKTGNMQKFPSTAVLLTGQLRFFEVVANITRRNFLDDIDGGFDLFYVGPNDQYYANGKQGLAWFKELKDTFVYHKVIQLVLPEHFFYLSSQSSEK